MNDKTVSPSSLNATVFSYTKGGPFPEWAYDEYNPAKKPLAVAVSGGSTRSYAAAVGQLRALKSLGILSDVGAISYSSGGAWFGSIFHYAPSSFSDEDLLGEYIAPQDLTKDNITELTPNSLLDTITKLPIAKTALELLAKSVISGEPPLNRIFSDTLGKIFLDNYSLNDNTKYLSLNTSTVEDIISRNPSLTTDSFYTMRSGRPYFLTGGTLITPNTEEPDEGTRLWAQCDYTPLYAGVPQLFKGKGQDDLDIGGGYVETFAFNSETVQEYDASTNSVQVQTPGYPFALSDLIGSAGASVGAKLINAGHANIMPEFWCWPNTNIGSTPGKLYSIVDSGTLENSAIVNLLRRGYTEIIAFINSQTTIDPPEKDHCGDPQGNAYGGLDGQITRLFGHGVPDDLPSQPDNQVFPQDQFDALADGLRKAKDEGGPIYFTDTYTTIENNTFDVPSYEVTVHWFYNDVNTNWVDAITDQDVLDILKSEDPLNYMANFPTLCYMEQNVSDIIELSARQVSLLANMQNYLVLKAFETIEPGKQ